MRLEEDFNSAAIGGVLESAPGIPFAFPSVVVSNVFCSLLKTLCSGSTISSVSSYWSITPPPGSPSKYWCIPRPFGQGETSIRWSLFRPRPLS